MTKITDPSHQAGTERSIGVGLLGPGKRLQSVLRRLVTGHPSIRVVAAYDQNPAVYDALRKPYGNFRAHAQAADLAQDPEVDWVLIGSWNNAHADHIAAAVEAGKHIFCEKPLAATLEDCLHIRKLLQGSRSRFVFGLVLRYAPLYDRIRTLIADGTVGAVLSLDFTETLHFDHGGYIMGGWRRSRAMAGPHILEKCCHDLDVANWLAGSLPVRVASFGARRFFVPDRASRATELGPDEHGTPAFESWRGRQEASPFSGDTDMLDAQVAILEYANGVQASFHTNTASALPERRFHLVGERGTVRGDLLTGELEYAPMQHMNLKYGGVRTAPPRFMQRLAHAGGHGGADDLMADNLRRVMQGNAEPQAGIAEALTAAIPAFAIDEAQRSGTIVDLRPLWRETGLFAGMELNP